MSKVLVLDAGHGLYTAGKQTLNGSKGVIKEWTLNNNVCNKIQTILKDYDVTIYRTDDKTGKTDISLSERVKRCDKYNPDLFVSIHHNATPGATGTEVYWHTKGTQEDKKVANLIAPKLAAKCGMKNRGVKQAAFTVLTVKSDAVLVEGGFMDSTKDYEFVVSDKGQQAYAEAIAESVIQYLGLKKKVVETTKTQSHGKIYQVIVGSYLERSNANKIKAKLEAEGYEGVWINATKKDGKTYYQIICGSYTARKNADNIKAKLDKSYKGVWINIKK